VTILADAVMKICAGEVRQQAIRHQYQATLDEYMPRIEAKTATLLAASCDIGSLLGGLASAPRAHLRDYGRLLGLAFQIADDVLDYTGTEDEVGKPIGHDVAEGFATLPLMLAMEEASIAGRLSPLLHSGHALTAVEAEQVVALVRSSQGPQRAIERARSLASDARHELETIGGGDAVQTLSALTDYVVSRKL
jgi:heptaprenyl diphosphate synthase